MSRSVRTPRRAAGERERNIETTERVPIEARKIKTIDPVETPRNRHRSTTAARRRARSGSMLRGWPAITLGPVRAVEAGRACATDRSTASRGLVPRSDPIGAIIERTRGAVLGGRGAGGRRRGRRRWRGRFHGGRGVAGSGERWRGRREVRQSRSTRRTGGNAAAAGEGRRAAGGARAAAVVGWRGCGRRCRHWQVEHDRRPAPPRVGGGEHALAR